MSYRNRTAAYVFLVPDRFGKPALIDVAWPSGLTIGEHDVRAVLTFRVAYLPFDTAVENKKRLRLQSGPRPGEFASSLLTNVSSRLRTIPHPEFGDRALSTHSKDLPAKLAVRQGPKQDRSRITVARILDVCYKLLEERGHEDFTLQDISNRANVSIGTIYGHFVSKEELVRSVQLRVVKQLTYEHTEAMGKLHTESFRLADIVPLVVEELGELHSNHADILRALMVRAWQDEMMARIGKQTDAHFASSFRSLILECRGEIPHPDPVAVIDSCFNTIYAAILRFQGLGTAPDVRGRGDWKQYLDHLGKMTMMFLLTPPPAEKKKRVSLLRKPR